jgi:hypothetical protein
MLAVMMASRMFFPGLGGSKFKTMPNQVQIHAALKRSITQPGTYVCPYLPLEERGPLFPDYLNEPIFAVTYRGHTHSTVPGFASVGMLSFLLAPMAAAWLLAHASDRIRAAYSRRLIFVAMLGFFVVAAADLLSALTEEQPFAEVAGKAFVSLITWASVGLVLAWKIRPGITGS